MRQGTSFDFVELVSSASSCSLLFRCREGHCLASFYPEQSHMITRTRSHPFSISPCYRNVSSNRKRSSLAAALKRLANLSKMLQMSLTIIGTCRGFLAPHCSISAFTIVTSGFDHLGVDSCCLHCTCFVAGPRRLREGYNLKQYCWLNPSSSG